MPSTINGIGTTYFGKRNLEVDRDTCEHCGQVADLATYETTYFICVLFIPIIPLGKKQILDQCPICTMHRAMPVEEYQQLKSQAIEASTEELATHSDDPDAAIKLLGTFAAFKEKQQAMDLANAMQNSFADNIDVQLTLGSWYEERGQMAQADACFNRAIQLDPNHPGAIRAKAVELMQSGQLDQARELFRGLEPPSEHFDPLLFFILAKAYQEKHDHAAAMELFQLIATQEPEFAKEKPFRKAMRASEKALKKAGGR